jgi:replicative DNA helicase
VPVVAAAQVNRGSEARTDKRPGLSDLRESGAIEADADTVILLYENPEQPGELELILAKNRHGPKTTVQVAWAPHYARARSLARFTK